MSPSAPLFPAGTLTNGPPKQLSLTCKLVMLLMFCLARSLDAFNNSALFVAIPALEGSMGITESESVWIISAFQLTFAAVLLISGRISGVYNPIFIGAVSALGILSVAAGFVNDKIPIILLRALIDNASAMTIPRTSADKPNARIAKWKRLDLIGVSILTGMTFLRHISVIVGHANWARLVAIILFIFPLTSGSADGWATAGVLVPLIMSVLMIDGFFYLETVIPVDKAAMFPIGLTAFAASFTGSLLRVFSPKWLILTGLSFLVVATTLLAFGGGRPDQYWPSVFPVFVLRSAGAMLTYTHANIAILQVAPASMAGTVGVWLCGRVCCSRLDRNLRGSYSR
ncbi:hypothetical protein PAXINDRAFT_13523 [Paxillus involutus ATCC 200175]|uniref:Major facilitator superfamily (MFS) profile domain-containing protein n=1 Tax=Paxillus involutus ATCC 200175 TaxID=664439 RepID=A0A0C9TDA6_PAXIN|nr:hypothetical protein PAXINDRAFT_13523 [Paxillus involutus ATCC 200175]